MKKILTSCTCPDEGRACESCLAKRLTIRRFYIKEPKLAVALLTRLEAEEAERSKARAFARLEAA